MNGGQNNVMENWREASVGGFRVQSNLASGVQT